MFRDNILDDYKLEFHHTVIKIKLNFLKIDKDQILAKSIYLY